MLSLNIFIVQADDTLYVWEVHQLLPGLVQEQQQAGKALGQDCVQRCQVCDKQECELAHKGNWAVTMGLQQVEDAGEL